MRRIPRPKSDGASKSSSSRSTTNSPCRNSGSQRPERTRMKAAYFMRNGGPEVMEYGEVPDPVAGPGQVLVDVHAASVNGADWKVRSGSYAPTTEFPYIPGRDFS